jgi:hypothetical protein
VRSMLVAALVSCAAKASKSQLRRFLSGLSADELEFLAGFQGARILEHGVSSASAQADYSSTGPNTPDRDHKMLILREYLSRCSSSPVERMPYFRARRRDGRSAPGLA